MVKQKQIFSYAEAARKIGMSEDELRIWVEEKLVAPSVLADSAETLFDEEDLVHLNQIKHLFDIGYGAEEIKKIAKKIGLPRPEKFKKKDRRVRRYLTVGELAERSGFNPRTIKYWEERGIIEPTTRSEGGFRLYDEHYVFLCSLIHDLQLFGYSLEAIKEIGDQFRLFYDIQTEVFNGSNAEKYSALEAMLAKIGELNGKMSELSKGIERWHKLLKEKQTDIQGRLRKLSKEQEKASTSIPAKAKSQS